MNRWYAFFKERIPLPINLFLTIGMILSTRALFPQIENKLHLYDLSLIFGVMLIFIELRFMDEVKDIDKDRIAHPTRPIPRGLISELEMKKLIKLTYFLLLFLSITIGLQRNLEAGISFALTTLTMGLMYVEYFLGEKLEKKPVLYALSHQYMIIFMVAFAAAFTSSELFYDIKTYLLGGFILTSFLNYEICRKLDPNADPILSTYLIKIGRTKTNIFSITTSIISCFIAYQLGFLLFALPLNLALIASLLVIKKDPSKYKLTEGIASLNLLLFSWTGFISVVIRDLI